MGVLVALGLVLGFAAVCFAAFLFVPAYVLHRGTRVVTCPEDSTSAEVAVNAARYAATSVLDRPTVELKTCSRWPGRAGCGQPCAAEIAGDELFA